MLVGTFRCAAPARGGAFADERRVVAGDGGGPTKADAQLPLAVRRSPTARASVVEWPPKASRFPPLDPVREAGARTDSAFSAAKLIAPYRCDAPARCGAFVDQRRVVAGDRGGRTLHHWLEESVVGRAVIGVHPSVLIATIGLRCAGALRRVRR